MMLLEELQDLYAIEGYVLIATDGLYHVYYDPCRDDAAEYLFDTCDIEELERFILKES